MLSWAGILQMSWGKCFAHSTWAKVGAVVRRAGLGPLVLWQEHVLYTTLGSWPAVSCGRMDRVSWSCGGSSWRCLAYLGALLYGRGGNSVFFSFGSANLLTTCRPPWPPLCGAMGGSSGGHLVALLGTFPSPTHSAHKLKSPCVKQARPRPRSIGPKARCRRCATCSVRQTC